MPIESTQINPDKRKPERKGIMPIIIVDAVTKEPREYKGRKKWGVKPVGGDWLSLYCDFKPERGQNFSVNITETKGKDGRIFKDAEIIGPAPGVPPPPPPQTPSVEAQFNQLKHNGKISWDDWTLAIRLIWDIVQDTGMPPAEGVALVSTTLIAYSNGKLETPVIPVQDVEIFPGNSEAKDDDIPW